MINHIIDKRTLIVVLVQWQKSRKWKTDLKFSDENLFSGRYSQIYKIIFRKIDELRRKIEKWTIDVSSCKKFYFQKRKKFYEQSSWWSISSQASRKKERNERNEREFWIDLHSGKSDVRQVELTESEAFLTGFIDELRWLINWPNSARISSGLTFSNNCCRVYKKIRRNFNSSVCFFLQHTFNNFVGLNIGSKASVSLSSKRFLNNDNKQIKNFSSVHCSRSS